MHKRLIQLGSRGCIPPWLEMGDIVLATIHDNLSNIRYAVVCNVCRQSHKVRLGIKCYLTGEEWEVVNEEDTCTG